MPRQGRIWHQLETGICSARDNGHSASNRVNRGGSWDNTADDLRSGNRDDDDPDDDDDDLGFRCASSSGCPTGRLHARGPGA